MNIIQIVFVFLFIVCINAILTIINKKHINTIVEKYSSSAVDISDIQNWGSYFDTIEGRGSVNYDIDSTTTQKKIVDAWYTSKSSPILKKVTKALPCDSNHVNTVTESSLCSKGQIGGELKPNYYESVFTPQAAVCYEIQEPSDEYKTAQSNYDEAITQSNTLREKKRILEQELADVILENSNLNNYNECYTLLGLTGTPEEKTIIDELKRVDSLYGKHYNTPSNIDTLDTSLQLYNECVSASNAASSFSNDINAHTWENTVATDTISSNLQTWSETEQPFRKLYKKNDFLSSSNVNGYDDASDNGFCYILKEYTPTQEQINSKKEETESNINVLKSTNSNLQQIMLSNQNRYYQAQSNLEYGPIAYHNTKSNYEIASNDYESAQQIYDTKSNDYAIAKSNYDEARDEYGDTAFTIPYDEWDGWTKIGNHTGYTYSVTYVLNHVVDHTEGVFRKRQFTTTGGHNIDSHSNLQCIRQATTQ
jgi:hypothetical protein